MPLNGPAVLHAGKTASYHGTISAAACAEQWSAFCVGIMICIGALIKTVAVLKGTQLSAYAFFAYRTLGAARFFGFRPFY